MVEQAYGVNLNRGRKMAIKKLAVAAAVSAAMGMGAVGNAQAEAVAQAALSLSGFSLGTYNTGTSTFSALTNTQFSQLALTDTATNNAALNSVFSFTGATTSVLGATVDALQACVGTCGGQNNFALSAVPPTTVFSRSDSLLFGTPINIAANTLPPTFTNPAVGAGAVAATLAETSLIGTSFGSAGSQLILTSSFQFVPTTTISNAAIAFSALQSLRAWTSADSVPGTLAGANTGWSISLSGADGSFFQWNPDGTSGGIHVGLTEVADSCNLAANVSAGAAQPNALQQCAGSFLAYANFDLLAGVQYSFNINHSSQTNAVSVPEPGSLALLGLGLLGLGFAGLRKKSA